MTIHRRTREEKTINRSVTKVSRANSASLPPERITNGFTETFVTDIYIYIYIYIYTYQTFEVIADKTMDVDHPKHVL